MPVKLTAKDYTLASIAGFVTGFCIIPVLANNGYHNNAVFVALPFVVALAWAIGIWLGKFLSQFWGLIFQLAKFAEVGFLNTAINFGLLNLISIMTGVTAGLATGSINIPGTIVSACNSYVWNKFWVFGKVDNKGFFADVPKFALITFIGLVVNSVLLIMFTSYLHPAAGISPSAWLNLGKVVATLGTFMINFLGYKFIVFVKETTK